ANLTGCHPFDVQIENLSTGAVDYNWNYGDGTNSTTTATNHSHTYLNTGTTSIFSDISLIAGTIEGCYDTSVVTVETYPQIIAQFEHDSVGCSPFNVDFTNLSTNAIAYQWDFGDGIQDVVTDPGHT